MIVFAANGYVCFHILFHNLADQVVHVNGPAIQKLNKKL